MDASLRRWYDIQTDNVPDEEQIAAAEKAAKEDAKRVARNKRARQNRQAREAALRSLGLTKCKGSDGETLWE